MVGPGKLWFMDPAYKFDMYTHAMVDAVKFWFTDPAYKSTDPAQKGILKQIPSFEVVF